MRIKQNFKSRENRDARARELRAQGYRVSVRSSRNVVLSPGYVADEDLSTASKNMFGGYDTDYYPTIYTLEAK